MYQCVHAKDKIEQFRPKRSLPDQPTTVIIGTGIIGLTSAYYLAKSGHRVVCIEKREDVALETR